MPQRILLLSLFIILSGLGHAQFKKNDRMAGASIGTGYFSSGKTDYGQDYITFSHAWSLSLTPFYGWFFNSHSAAGMNLILNASGEKDWNESGGLTYKRDIRNNMDYGLGIFYRYYFSAGGNWIPFVHTYANGGSGRTRTSGFYYGTGVSQTYSGKSSARGFYNLGINAGLTRKLNKNTGLDLMIGYGHSYASMTTTTESVKTTNTGTVTEQYVQPQAFRGNALNIGIGLQVFLLK